ncbi:hypothetical protein ACVI1T_000753 [Rhizobium redzepovicii]
MGGRRLPAAGFDPQEWREHGQAWTATSFSLSQLREFGLDPACGQARRRVELIGTNAVGKKTASPIGSAKSKNASTAARSPTALISASMSRQLSTG